MTANKICIINQKAHYKALAIWLLFKKKKNKTTISCIYGSETKLKKKISFEYLKTRNM